MWISLLGVILIPLMFTRTTAERASITHIEICDVEVDADIGGDGIRIATWVQESVLLLIAFLGTFHCSATGAKEIGAGLALTHVSLVIALLVQLGRGSLTSADAILGSMIIDSQCSALSMQLVAKETLASRLQVATVLLCQILGLTVLPILVDGFGSGKFATKDCSCVAVFWWGWLSDCSAFAPREMAIFWTYYAYRCVAFLQCCYHSLSNTIQFHDAEKHGTRLEGITYPTMIVSDLEPPNDGMPNDTDSASEDEEFLEQEAKADGSRYPDYPATVSLMYTVYGLFALVSMAAAEIAMRDYGLRPSSQLFSVGQIIGMVVAGATIVRGLFLLTMMLLAGGAGFTWPLSFEVGLEVAGFGPRSRGRTCSYREQGRARAFPRRGTHRMESYDLAISSGKHRTRTNSSLWWLNQTR
ncbi:unnamed protein product [Parascedosporium putredinis]|uniref:Uncharacterized protein n=1 Tax=Parascedosporium putredinis TaxID=1442378 RepID=A0A9P1H482_9PEZI|nr:unnamed protein product [Parascedosporium putredinis]CAI7996355.1 unnamed protein product [Parascedosporium putredinis]